jgi:hypothetical protein
VDFIVEPVSCVNGKVTSRSGFKPQIRFKGKTQADEKAQSRQRRDEQYILRRFATQPLGIRWGFATTSSICMVFKIYCAEEVGRGYKGQGTASF